MTDGNTELVVNSYSYIVYPSQAKGKNEVSKGHSHCVGLAKSGNLRLNKMATLGKVIKHVRFLLVRKQTRSPAL